MLIYIARHGDAEPFGSGVKDSERALTVRGRNEVSAVARKMQAAGESASLVVASPFRRAQETAEIFAESWQVASAIETEPAITPSGNIEIAEQFLRSLEVPSVLLASHMPTVSYLTNKLVPAAQMMSFGTANVAKIHLSDQGAELIQFYQP